MFSVFAGMLPPFQTYRKGVEGGSKTATAVLSEKRPP